MPKRVRTVPPPAIPERGRLRAMKVSLGFREYVLDQLAGISGLSARAMFGGIGLYSGEVFFGILASDVLYLKVDDSNRLQYDRSGMAPFKPYANRPMTMPYYEVPLRVLEDQRTLVAWARQSLQVAKAGKAAKAKR